jgi:UDPglucose 6-dehydrogenase
MEDRMFINIVGYGYVGSAVGHLCKRNDVPFCIMDLSKKTIENETEKVGGFTEIESLIANSEAHNKTNVYFIAVPTPSSPSGECDTSIVESVVSSIAVNHTKESLILIKSTLKPGTCTNLQKKCGSKSLHITYCPEFLREKTFQEDMYNANFVLLGAQSSAQSSAQSIGTGTGNVNAIRVMKELYSHNKDIDVICKSYEECEIFKYTINVFLAVKVWYFNEINVLCERYGVDYKSLQSLFYLEPRIGESHIDVPGHDGYYGFGGKCLPKETRGMNFLQKSLGIDNKVLANILKRNELFRNKEI